MCYPGLDPTAMCEAVTDPHGQVASAVPEPTEETASA